MKKSKEYCFIVPTLHAGGVENYVLRYISHASKVNRYTLISLCMESGDLHEDFMKQGAKIVYKRMGYLNIIKQRHFYRFLKSNHFDTIVDFTGNFGGLRMKIAKWAGIKNRIVFYRRSNNGFENSLIKNLYNSFENRMVYKNATRILSNSSYAFQYFFPREYKQDRRFKVIRNGLNGEQFYKVADKNALRERYSIPENTFVIGHIGRFDPAKNHETIFEVARELIKKDDRILFVFCGKGTDGKLFKEQLVRFKIDPNCLCLGLIADVNKVLNLFDVFYFPSLAEGQPNALIEAMLAELPIVASNIPSIVETMPKATHTGLLDPRNSQEHVHALLNIKLRREADVNLLHQYREWAKEKYDSRKNFKLFENEL